MSMFQCFTHGMMELVRDFKYKKNVCDVFQGESVHIREQ
jgi:hypothetical protein